MRAVRLSIVAVVLCVWRAEGLGQCSEECGCCPDDTFLDLGSKLCRRWDSTVACRKDRDGCRARGHAAASACTEDAETFRAKLEALKKLAEVKGGSPGLPSPNSGGFGPPSSSLTLTFLWNKVPAWGDLPDSQFRNPHPVVQGIPTFVPSAVLAQGSEVKLHCPNVPSLYEACDVHVFFYTCPQTCTTKYQGGIQASLMGDSNWQLTNCAMGFVTGAGPLPFPHPMRSFRRKLLPGESAAVVVPDRAEFLAFGIDVSAKNCAARNTEAGCAAAGPGCEWESGQAVCVPARCFTGGKGPPPACAGCPWQGIVSRPRSDGPFETEVKGAATTQLPLPSFLFR